MPRKRLWLFSLFALFMAEVRPALGYDEDVHAFLARAALEGAGLDVAAQPIDAATLSRLRVEIDQAVRTSSNAGLRAEWVRRFPVPERFDAWAFKELMLFDPRAEVFGIDRVPETIPTLLEAIALGSRQPDDDRRNRDRVAFDESRRPLVDESGALVPADPAILNMGKLGALSSQAHAHYGLANVEFSHEPLVLKTDPRRFGVRSGYPPGPILTLAAEMAQAHVDLGLIAALMPEPSPTLAWMLTGQAFHYVQDVTNQIHTVQVGIYAFFVDATLAQYVLSLRTGGGYFGELRSMPSIGIDILTNHHVISEQLVRRRLLDAVAGQPTPEGRRLVAAPRTDDRDFQAALDKALVGLSTSVGLSVSGRNESDRPDTSLRWAPYAEALTRATIEASSIEGGDVYAKVRAIADGKYRRTGVLYSEKTDDPISATDPDRDRAAYDELFALGERAFRRAGVVTRTLVRLEREQMDVAPEGRSEALGAVVERFARRQLRLLGEAEARRAAYLAQPRSGAAGPERMPQALGLEVVVLLGAVWGLRRVWRRKVTRARARGT